MKQNIVDTMWSIFPIHKKILFTNAESKLHLMVAQDTAIISTCSGDRKGQEIKEPHFNQPVEQSMRQGKKRERKTFISLPVTGDSNNI